MIKIDKTLTKEIQSWLETPTDERDMRRGAELVLMLTRNRALYNSINAKPEKFKAKAEYELKKFLNIRLANMAIADVTAYEAKVTPKIEETVQRVPVLDADDELPDPTKAKGMRSDHDALPPEIQELWTGNLAKYRKIVLLFNELKAMADMQPCDRFEKLKMLDELDKSYRERLERYDNYVPGSEPVKEAEPKDGTPPAPDNIVAYRKIKAARKSLTKYKQRLSLDTDGIAKEKCQEMVNTISSLGGTFKEDMIRELSAYGIRFK